jgi:hypothetical protein
MELVILKVPFFELNPELTVASSRNFCHDTNHFFLPSCLYHFSWIVHDAKWSYSSWMCCQLLNYIQ